MSDVLKPNCRRTMSYSCPLVKWELVIDVVASVSASECGHVVRFDTIVSLYCSVESHGVDSGADSVSVGMDCASLVDTRGTKDVHVSVGENSIVVHVDTAPGMTPDLHSADGVPDFEVACTEIEI